MKPSAEGRVVVINGGRQGRGLATAGAWALTGAHAGLPARRAEPLELARAEITSLGGGGRVLPVVGDVSSAASIEAAQAAMVATPGPVEGLVNNAGEASSYLTGTTINIDGGSCPVV